MATCYGLTCMLNPHAHLSAPRQRPLGTFPDMTATRQCSRTGCAEPAAVTFTYQYARSVVCLDDLSNERDPHGYDLCDHHGERLKVPSGWRLEDRRHSRFTLLTARLAG